MSDIQTGCSIGESPKIIPAEQRAETRRRYNRGGGWGLENPVEVCEIKFSLWIRARGAAVVVVVVVVVVVFNFRFALGGFALRVAGSPSDRHRDNTVALTNDVGGSVAADDDSRR
jgi:hypothetical protein